MSYIVQNLLIQGFYFFSLSLLLLVFTNITSSTANAFRRRINNRIMMKTKKINMKFHTKKVERKKIAASAAVNNEKGSCDRLQNHNILKLYAFRLPRQSTAMVITVAYHYKIVDCNKMSQRKYKNFKVFSLHFHFLLSLWKTMETKASTLT